MSSNGIKKNMIEVEISHTPKGAGAVSISYLNLDQLDDICRRLMGAAV